MFARIYKASYLYFALPTHYAITTQLIADCIYDLITLCSNKNKCWIKQMNTTFCFVYINTLPFGFKSIRNFIYIWRVLHKVTHR